MTASQRLVLSCIQLQRILRALDPTPQLLPAEASALAVLIHGGRMTMGQLATFEDVRPPSMTRTVSALVEKQLVRRMANESDARQTLLEITRQGRTLFDQGQARRLQPLIHAIRALDSTALTRLVDALPVLESLCASLRADAQRAD
ncbi:MAG: MarR family transcriptional regulator [Aquimonas sp.]|nr:MarR family transcriptional regulator [Aquimonas sp.]